MNKILSAANKTVDDLLKMIGEYAVQILRGGVIVATIAFTNTIVNEGKNKLFDVMFNGATQITTWYIGLMDNASYSASPVTDTAGSHAGWTEFTAYSESVRQTWGVDDPASQQISNSTAAVFSVNGSGTLRGIFIGSVNTKSASTGTLWSTALFPTTLPVTSGDQIKIVYTVAA